MLGIMASGFRLSNHSSVGQGRILLIGPWDPWWGKFKWGELRDIQGFSSLSYWFLMGFWCYSLDFPEHAIHWKNLASWIIFVMDERVIFLWYPCHVYVCAFMYSLYSTLQIPCKYTQFHPPFAVLPFWPICIYLSQQLPCLAAESCSLQELQATGFRIDQQMRDAKLLGLTQVGRGARERVFRFRIFWWRFSDAKNLSPFFGTYQK